MLPAVESLYAQYHIEDWPSFPKSDNQYYSDTRVLNFPLVDIFGSLKAYTDDIGNANAPLFIDLYNSTPTALFTYDYGFYTCGLNYV